MVPRKVYESISRIKRVKVKAIAEARIGNIIKFNKDDEIELPFWMAEELERNGLVKIKDIDIDELGKILFQERQSMNRPAELYPLPKNFYLEIHKMIDNRVNSADKDKKKLDIMKQIVDIRKRKLTQLASLNPLDQRIINNITEEEYYVVTRLSEILQLMWLP
ncbi:hypothetical protein HS7_19760 [Sulfolobales archaeon HS-7]|nr:hypothetical protein HS7_19760 [Sulfolobales archaeon HS-7]